MVLVLLKEELVLEPRLERLLALLVLLQASARWTMWQWRLALVQEQRQDSVPLAVSVWPCSWQRSALAS